MVIGPWMSLALAVPVLLLGELLVRWWSPLDRFRIPVPVVGGLAVALSVLVLKAFGLVELSFSLGVDLAAWNWIITAEPLLAGAPVRSVYLPFMIAFFTCVGLNADAKLIRLGGWPLLVFWGLATVLAALQLAVGVALAVVLGAPAMMGLVCGPMSMTGGHGTTGAFAGEAAAAGLDGAMSIGIAAATFGLVAGGLLGGPVGRHLLRTGRGSASTEHGADSAAAKSFAGEVVDLIAGGRRAVFHLVVLLVCMKAGAWLGYGIESIEIAGEPLKFPSYIGAMIVGIFVRNTLGLWRRVGLDAEIVTRLMFVSLGVFLSVSMMSLDLSELAGSAVTMLAILGAQVLFMAVFAVTVIYGVMGKDRDAAVMAAGHCGFGLGATPNAVANMEALVKAYGPARRAFLIVPIVGAFLMDFTNAIVITVGLNLL